MFTNSIKKRTRAAYSRILFNKTTAAFLVFSFIFCFAQGIMQSFLLSIDSEYKGLLHNIIQTVEPGALLNLTDIPTQIHATSIPLRLCNDVAIGERRRRENCTIIFDTTQPIVPPSRTIVMDDVKIGDRVVIQDDAGFSTEVDSTCAQTLLYANQNIRNFNSEDLSLLLLQFWLFIISTLAVTNESIAHLWTAFMTRILMTAWSAYSIWRTNNFKDIFWRLYADKGTPCHADLFSKYLSTRWSYEIPDLVLNATGLLTACWMSWSLLRIYGAQAMRYVGAPEHINRINKLFLAVLSCLQLEVFILMTAMGLWVDILHNTAISRISAHTPLYLGVFITTTVILIPWISLGWYGIRREMKKTIALFFFLAFVIILGWSVMFYSLVYRWTFTQWPFLACCSVASFVLIVSSTILAIICRLNFDRGLKQYLEAEAALAESGFAPEVFRHDEEKNTPLDLNTADFKMPMFSPVSSKYEQPMPTYIAPPSHSRSGSADTSAAGERRPSAQGAPLPASGLAERMARMSVQSPPKYNVRLGEAF